MEYLLQECRGADTKQQSNANGRLGVVYLMGDFFCGILVTEVALKLHWLAYRDHVVFRGLILVNSVTSYLRLSLYELGPPIVNTEWGGKSQYVFPLATTLIPLILDQG